jgi:phospholipase C
MTSRFLGLAMFLVIGCGGAANESAPGEADTDPIVDDDASSGGETGDDASVDDTGVVADAMTDAVVEGEGESVPKCPTPAIADPTAADRTACKFAKGDKVGETLGVTKAIRDSIPINHIVVVMNENRSFDHYFGHLATEGQPDAEAIPATFSNKDAAGKVIKPFHLASTCLERDPPHGWTPYHDKVNGGKNDGYVTASDVSGSNGHYAMGYYTAADLPFYNYLAKTFAISDRYFASVIGPTWPNRDYLYAATSDGVINTGERVITVRTIFDELTTAKVSWGIYGDGGSRAGCANIDSGNPHHHGLTEFYNDLKDGSLPSVVFLDPTGKQDEHPDADVQGGEAWSRAIYQAAIKSPLWKKMAIFYTYDEAGGIFDHVAPPKACLASASESKFDRLGSRVPVMVVSPYARPHFVSHKTHSHTSITRFIELIHDLPALTGRDANSDAMLDLFDFNCPSLLDPPTAPAAGKGGCP